MEIKMKIGFFSFLIQYIKKHIKTIILISIFIFSFVIIFSLYNLPVEAVWYSSLLCIVFGIIFLLADFVEYYKRHKLLTELQNQITLSIDELPSPKDLLEKDYQSLIAVLYSDKIDFVSKSDSNRTNLIDYYTLWVHQIKTPIAAMRLLLQSKETQENDELLMELFKIEQYVEMVLGYLRLDSDYTDFILKKYRLDSIVKQAVRKFAKQFIRKKISLDYTESDTEVITDEKWLVFAIEQILSNALKYTNQGKILIYTIDGKTLVIEDTGIGIEAEDLPRVFEKGFTGYNGRNDKKSTGIGLYLCKQILTKLGHTITIESETGKGTRVKIGLDTVKLNIE